MAEPDALSIYLGDGFHLLASGVRRERSGKLTADLILDNGRCLYADRTALNDAHAVHAWTEQAANGPDRPLPEHLKEAVLALLRDALSLLQEPPVRQPMTQDDIVVAVFLARMDAAEKEGLPVELFHDPDGNGWATVPVGEHLENLPVSSRSFRHLLARWYYEERGKTTSQYAETEAAHMLAAEAEYDGRERPIFTRMAGSNGRIYLDLANEQRQVVEIDASGFRIVPNPPVKFRRSRGMLPLPIPQVGGSLDLLRAFINVPDDKDWCLVVAWLVGALRPKGPYPILVTHGEQGSAKSTLHRILRALVDPNKALIRTLFRDERDLMISAKHSWVLAYDNLSHLAPWQSDALCRVSTGGGLSTRTLYENDEETIFDTQRPILLNGIEELATQPDLLNRSMIVYLPAIPEEERRPEADLWPEFEQVRPLILGALLDAVSTAIRNELQTERRGLPRMADFARWVVAAEPAMPWEKGAFVAAYADNQDAANDLTLEASPVSQAMRDLATSLDDPWEGTATELLKALDDQPSVNDATRNLKSWPRSGQSLTGKLRRLTPNLRAVGVTVTLGVRKHGGRRIVIVEADQGRNTSSPASPVSPADESSDVDGQIGADDTVTMFATGDDDENLTATTSSPEYPWNDAEDDDGDDGDAILQVRPDAVCCLCGDPLLAGNCYVCAACATGDWRSSDKSED